MSRETSSDFKLLCDFIESYQLKDMTQNEEFTLSLSRMHKKLFALITFISEIHHQDANEPNRILPIDSFLYLHEAVSDLGQSLFCWLHGAYKPAYLILRSAIETFLKSIIGINDESVYLEKSMYKIIEMAQQSPFFSEGLKMDLFDRIHTCYKDLCRYAHTAESSNMSHISALKAFPSFLEFEGMKFADDYAALVTDVLSLLFTAFNVYFHKMHHRNQMNIYSALPKIIKRTVHDNKEG